MSGRRVVVTGGATGIGRAVAEHAATRGDRVVIVGRDATRLQAVAETSEAIVHRVCDVRDEDAVTKLFMELGPVDVLVANAGSATAAPLSRTSLEHWNDEQAINATAVFLCARAVMPVMRERGHGRVVVVASVAGISGAKYVSSYTASKHAAVGLVRALAAEFAGSGVTINAVCPTFVDTPMTARAIDAIASTTGLSPAEALQVLQDQSPLRRLLEPAEVAAAIDYLAAVESGAVTGHCLVLGGFEAR
jgi:NAD(P)-dependent dehydrogenase (short-subunit alcohol dehydrogenase family)